MAIDRAGSAPRSFLYVPGDRPDRLHKAVGRGADAIIVDLEDSVAVADKVAARENVRDWLAGQDASSHCQLWVRLNPGLLEAEIPAVVKPALCGLVVPKAEPALLARVDALLTQEEGRAGLAGGQVQVIALVETARGLLDVARLAAGPRLVRLGIGEADLIGELGLRPGPDREELTALRLQVVVASAAAGIAAPVAPTSTDFRDLDRFRRTTQALLGLGFRSRTAIHPAQVPVINEVFTPTSDEVAEARRLVQRFADAESGVILDEHGRMVDVAVLRSARETLVREPIGPVS